MKTDWLEKNCYYGKRISIGLTVTDIKQAEAGKKAKSKYEKLADANRLAKKVDELVQEGYTLEQAIETVIKENPNSIALSKANTANPAKSLENWYKGRYFDNKKSHNSRDDDDAR